MAAIPTWLCLTKSTLAELNFDCHRTIVPILDSLYYPERVKRLLVLSALPVLLGAAAPAGISAQNAWIRYLLPSVPAGGYLTLNNASDYPVVLTGASSPACGSLMLHKSETMSGMAMMVKVPSITVPAHGNVSFAEGGYHLMCMQPAMKLGDKISVTLTFQDGSTLPLSVPVYGPAGPGQ